MADLSIRELAEQLTQGVMSPLVDASTFQDELEESDVETLQKVWRLRNRSAIEQALLVAYESGRQVGLAEAQESTELLESQAETAEDVDVQSSAA